MCSGTIAKEVRAGGPGARRCGRPDVAEVCPDRLGQGGHPVEPSRFAAAAGVAAGLGVIAFAACGAGWAAAAAALGLSLPFLAEAACDAPVRAFDAQIATALSLIVASLRREKPSPTRLEVVARKMPPPARDEFRKAYASVAAGAAPAEAAC